MDTGERKASSIRRLARQELELWREVTRHVKPMPGKSAPIVATGVPAPLPASTPSPLARTGSSLPKSPGSQIKPLAPLEHGLLRKLSRGRSDLDARIDLHGMRQAEAHRHLRSFLQRAHADGLTLTLVVTGKGVDAGETHRYEERGVLRRMLPHWLSAADLRHIVLGFTEAARRHGGEGAFYVRLRAANSRRIRPTP